MEMYKKTKNLEFEAIYEDGNRKHISKGILFEETEKGTLDVHIGTDNQMNMLIAVFKAIADLISMMSKGKLTIEIRESGKESHE